MDKLIPLVENTSEPLSMQDKIIQHAQVKKAEHELLYAFITIPDSRPVISGFVFKDWFVDPEVRYCMLQLLTLYRYNQPLDSHEAHQDIFEHIKRIDFNNIVGEFWNGALYTLKEDHNKRILRIVNLENQATFINPKLSTKQKVAKVNSAIMQVHDEIVKSDQPTKQDKLAAVLKYTVDCMEGNLKFCPWGIKGLDNYMKLRKNACYFVGALPGTGKTAFAISGMIAQCKLGKRVFFWCAEMTETQIYLRILTHLTGYALDILEAEQDDKKVPKDMEIGISNAIATINSWDFHTRCGRAMTFSQIASEIRTLNAIKPVDSAWLDYFGNIQPRPEMAQSQKHEQMSDICKEVEALKLEIETPIILLAQIKRDAVDRYPKKTDLAESTSCEQIADGVILIDRPVKGRDKTERNYWMNNRTVALSEVFGKCVLVVAKNRHGAERDSVYNFNPQFYKFLAEDKISIEKPPPVQEKDGAPIKPKPVEGADETVAAHRGAKD